MKSGCSDMVLYFMTLIIQRKCVVELSIYLLFTKLMQILIQCINKDIDSRRVTVECLLLLVYACQSVTIFRLLYKA